ncbi:hypothetical protein C7S13_0056 [Burkholderia cepacia]|nr:hypothetical protein [Burkholderia cepacia]QOH33055.1 hypothetical protein C7S14_3956 [Burkholderia cepacia]
MSDNIRHKAFPKAKLAQFIDRTSFFFTQVLPLAADCS